MNIFAVAAKVTEVEDVSLTAYQVEALLEIINKLPEIEKKALERVGFDTDLDSGSIANHAIQNLKENETFVAVASLGSMSTTDLVNILTALATGHEDEFGYWAMIDDEESEEDIKKTDDVKKSTLIEDFLQSRICYGKPTPDHDSYYVEHGERPFEQIYIRLLQSRGLSVEDPCVVWLDPNCQDVIDNKLKVATIIDLLKTLDAYSEPDFIHRYSKAVNDNIQAFFEFWLGENYGKYAD